MLTFIILQQTGALLVDVVSRADGKTRELVFKAWDRAEQAVYGRTKSRKRWSLFRVKPS
jgi:hypothetical protein